MKKAKEQYTVQLEPEFVAKLDKMADKIGVSRSQLMRNLLESAYEDCVLLEKIGLLAAFKFGQKLVKNIKEGIATGRINFDQEGNLKIKDKE
jgi:predicted transcriptional regulator